MRIPTYNLDFLPVEDRGPFLGPFQYSSAPDAAQQAAIAEVIRSEIVLVAEDEGEIVGVLRGRKIQMPHRTFREARESLLVKLSFPEGLG